MWENLLFALQQVSWKIIHRTFETQGSLYNLLSRTLCNEASSFESFDLKKEILCLRLLATWSHQIMTQSCACPLFVPPPDPQSQKETTRLYGGCTVYFPFGKNCIEGIAGALTSRVASGKLHRFLNFSSTMKWVQNIMHKVVKKIQCDNRPTKSCRGNVNMVAGHLMLPLIPSPSINKLNKIV